MTSYSSIKGKGSGVASYELKEDGIVLYYESRTGKLRSFLYSYAISGKEHVEQIIGFAKRSEHLNTYLSKHRIRYRELLEAE